MKNTYKPTQKKKKQPRYIPPISPGNEWKDIILQKMSDSLRTILQLFIYRDNTTYQGRLIIA